jgi:hypothetical protein
VRRSRSVIGGSGSRSALAVAFEKEATAVATKGPNRRCAVHEAVQAHLHVDSAAIMLVGDVDAFGEALESAGLGPIVIERDPQPETLLVSELDEAPGPVDQDDQEGRPPAPRSPSYRARRRRPSSPAETRSAAAAVRRERGGVPLTSRIAQSLPWTTGMAVSLPPSTAGRYLRPQWYRRKGHCKVRLP